MGKTLHPVGWLALAAALAAPGGIVRAQQLSPEQQAMMVLNSARRAYNEQKYAFAAERFREFLKLYGGHKEAISAHYGLALSLLEAPQKDYQAAVAALQQVAARQDFPDRPFALYNLGAAFRGLGEAALAAAAAKPNEAPTHRNVANQNFLQAANQFAAAAGAFAARVKPAPAPAEKLPDDLEWAARARCDHCEMLLRTAQFKEAARLAGAFLADAAMAHSRYRNLALYQLGYAHFEMQDYPSAGRALSRLAPFQQPFGLHTRYLLARIHHLCGERPEAAIQYKAVLAGYEQRKKEAQEALKNPAALQPGQKQALEALVAGPPPEYLLRCPFYTALLLAEEGQYADALAGFTGLLQQQPTSPLASEAQLRQGYCQVQLRNFAEAVKLLQPLCADPQLADRALWWTAQAQVGAADPTNAPAHAQALAGAMDALRRAAAAAGELAKTDPAAKVRRGDILLELADTQQLAGQLKEAAATYQQVLAEKNNPERAEEAMQRQVTALHLAGMYQQSDELCAVFEKTYPRSTLLPAVWFRNAENAYLTATAASQAPNPPAARELDRLFGVAIERYRRLIEKYPEFTCANLARQGLAASLYRLGRYAEAAEVLAAIPQTDRSGELASVAYLLADCLIRALPEETDDALHAARLVDQAAEAAKLLEGFLAEQAKSPQAPDALCKLGQSYQRIAAVLASPAERREMLSQARVAYERLLQQFPKDAAAPTALMERARCLALLGDVNGAINELNRFQSDPLRSAAVAPLAVLRLSALLRAQNRPAEAAKACAACRALHEPNLLKDPDRGDWAALLQYEHALAVKDSGKPAEARAIFEALAKQFPTHPQATAALWRSAECDRVELSSRLAAQRQLAANPAAKPDQLAAAAAAVEAGIKTLYQTVESLQQRCAELGRRKGGSQDHLRMLYELAWCYRGLAEAEIELARQRLQQEALAAMQAKLAKQSPPAPAAAMLPPEVPLATIPVRLTESAACQQYEELIAAAPQDALAVQARFELAEMHADRGNHDSAVKLLAEVLGISPPPALAQQIRLRMAACLLARNDPKGALAHLQALDPKAGSAQPALAQARYLTGQAYAQQADWGKAIEQLVAFRDQGPFQNVAGISDRGLLVLGGAYAQAGQWPASRQAFEILVQRFPNSPWADQALYGIGWAWQNEKQYEQAVNAYAQVTRRTASEVAAKAQLQIGLCRLEQQRYPEAAQALLVVPYTYEYPELSAEAWCEAGRAQLLLKDPAAAAKLYQRVIQDYPASSWAQLARQRLGEIK